MPNTGKIKLHVLGRLLGFRRSLRSLGKGILLLEAQTNLSEFQKEIVKKLVHGGEDGSEGTQGLSLFS